MSDDHIEIGEGFLLWAPVGRPRWHQRLIQAWRMWRFRRRGGSSGWTEMGSTTWTDLS